MLDSNTKKRIDDCRDILVGKLPDPKSQIDQITLALIYKFMDDMDQQSKDFGGVASFFTGGFEKYSWSSIMSSQIGANEMLKLYSEGIEGMSENENIQPLFRSIFKDAYLPYRDPETLKMFLKKIDEFSYDHSEVLGDAFEYLLSVMGSQGDAGQFRTPRHIIDFMVDITSPKKDETILDPSCGTSGFLISAYKKILSDNTKDRPGDMLSSMEKKKLLGNVSGYDISPDMIRLSLANLFLHGFNEDNLRIFEYDTLTSLDRWNEYYDVILANPPFMTPKGGIRPHNRFSIKSNRAEVLFVNYIIEHLTPKGRSAIVVPEGILFKTDKSYKDLRKLLIENSLIGLVSLPSGVFNPYSGVKTSILILDRELSQKTDKIFTVKIQNDGYGLGSKRKEIDKNDIPKIKENILEYTANLRSGIDEDHSELLYISRKDILNSNDIDFNYDTYNNNFDFNKEFPFISLGECCEIINGSTPKRSEKKYWDEGEVPWMTIEDIRKSGGEIYSTIQHITENAVKETSIKILPKNSVLISCTATIGEVAIAKIKITSNQQFNGLVIKDEFRDKLSYDFLYWMCKNLKKYLLKVSGKTSFNFVSVSKLKKLKIPLPSPEIQKDIVEELEQYQKIVEEKKKIIDTYTNKLEERINKIWET